MKLRGAKLGLNGPKRRSVRLSRPRRLKRRQPPLKERSYGMPLLDAVFESEEMRNH